MKAIVLVLLLLVCWIQAKKHNQINVGKNQYVELTEIPFGYTPGHEAFSYLSNEEQTALTRVIDSSNLDTHHDHALYIQNAFRNSTLFQRLTPHNVNLMMHRNKPFVIFLLCNCEADSQEWELKDLEHEIKLKKWDEKFSFLFSTPQTTKQFQLIHRFNLKKLPALILDNIPVGPNNEKYVYKHDGIEGATDSSIDGIMGFLSDFIHQNLQLTMLSEEHHLPPKKGEVWHITGNDFNHLVMENDKDVLLLVYSPFCAACHWMQNVFKDMAKHYQNMDNFILGTFDKTKNDFPIRGIKIRVYPTILLFPGKHKQKWIDFRQFSIKNRVPWDEVGFTNFLAKKASHRLNKKKILKEVEPDFDHDMVILHPDNFNKVVYDNTKDVFLMIHAFWCPHCVRAKPIVVELAKKYKVDPGVVIASVESKHHKLVDKFQRGYPTFLLFRKGKKSQPLHYEMRRTVPLFSAFIEKNRITPSRLPKPKMFHPHYHGTTLRWYKKATQEAYFEQTNKDNTWNEYVNHRKTASFKEVNYDPETKEALLFDKSRTMYVKLTKSQASWSSKQSGPWHRFDGGKWYGKASK